MTKTYEVRVTSDLWPEADMEVRVEQTGNGLLFRGYAAVFDSPSEPLMGFDGGAVREIIKPTAFDKTLREAASPSKRSGRDIKMFLNHNSDVVLGSTRAGTLRLTTDSRGLLAEADLPDSEWGRPVGVATERGDISTMSFGFSPVKTDPKAPRDQQWLTEVRLFEVSPVTAWPAYPATSASVRTLEGLLEDEDALQAYIADLTDERAELLARALRARPTSERYVSADLAERLARLEAQKAAA